MYKKYSQHFCSKSLWIFYCNKRKKINQPASQITCWLIKIFQFLNVVKNKGSLTL